MERITRKNNLSNSLRQLCKKVYGTSFDKQVKAVCRVTAIITRLVCMAAMTIVMALTYAWLGIKTGVTAAVNFIRRYTYLRRAVKAVLITVGGTTMLLLMFLLPIKLKFMLEDAEKKPYVMAEYTVKTNDTIWDISRENCADIGYCQEEYMYIVTHSNDLGTYIYPGQTILIPVLDEKAVAEGGNE